MSENGDGLVLDFSASDTRAGFRLERLEVYNWGTFHDRVWTLHPRGENMLLTGDIGSGKSTLVDAVTTLLVPPQRQAYNKAAGAETRERTLRSYVLGYYKAERGDAGLSARPVALRGRNNYSVILGCFHNEGYGQRVTIAQVFWQKDEGAPPARLFIVADAALSIAEHFANFGAEIGDLRKKLRRMQKVEPFDSFPPYAAAFRRRFGIDNEQALDLFHQTVSMKSVGNLTDFVREHMLEPFAVEERIAGLLDHFDNLRRAHEAVLRAKTQIERLDPLVANCDRHAALAENISEGRACRDALAGFFAGLKAEMLARRIEQLVEDCARCEEQKRGLRESKARDERERDEIKRAIAEAGGDRIEQIKIEILRSTTDKNERGRRANDYDALALAAGLFPSRDAEMFRSNLRTIEETREAAKARQATAQNARTQAAVEMHALREKHSVIEAELSSLRKRRSNIPARVMAIRGSLCAALKMREDNFPFVGELLSVRAEERSWEGAIERVLHGFGLSLLVDDADHQKVAEWVDRTHLGDRLVYFRVRESRRKEAPSPSLTSLLGKVAIKPDSHFYPWLEAELQERFDYACCDSVAQFRREKKALTRNGQMHTNGVRHEKDDRNAIDDRSRYVLGWSNEEKIATLEKQSRDFETRIADKGSVIAALIGELETVSAQLTRLDQLSAFREFVDLDWRSPATEIARLEAQKKQLESESDRLATLQRQLTEIEERLRTGGEQLEDAIATHRTAVDDLARARGDVTDCEKQVALVEETARTRYFPRLESLRIEALGPHTLILESCNDRERKMRVWLQHRIDDDGKRLDKLSENIVGMMKTYAIDYPLETREFDASLNAADEFRRMLTALRSDDLPRFELRFKELLNENTIHEVAAFQSRLGLEKQTIRERIDVINRSLKSIDYNPGRYIVVEATLANDVEVRDFQQDLRACTEGTLAGDDDAAYSNAKFEQVKRIIERFRGREGSTELDRRWTRKVTDVRNWFVFSASERWREDDREHEHYADSGGKSGGQKEKLAYTVLAASLAYQFGLEWGAKRSRTFRFVVIDEAFGRGSDESSRYALALFQKLNLQLLIVTPLQKIHIIEPYVAGVGFVHNEDGRCSMLRNLTIEEYRAERDRTRDKDRTPADSVG